MQGGCQRKTDVSITIESTNSIRFSGRIRDQEEHFYEMPGVIPERGMADRK